MIDLDNFVWDKLVFVCYRGGYAGDFFCNLLHQNYDKNYDFSPLDVKLNKYYYNSVSNLWLKNINDVFNVHENEIEMNLLLEKIDKVAPTNVAYYNRILNAYERCYHPKHSTYVENVSKYIRELYYEKYDKGFYVNNTHYNRPIYSFKKQLYDFDFKKTFPGSTSILLTSNNRMYNLFFNLFSLIKNKHIGKFFFNNNKNNFLKAVNFVPTSFNGMLEIDIGKLIFEPDSISKIEQQLTEIIKKPITLNRDKLKYYREKSIETLCSFMDVNNIEDIEEQLLIENMVKYVGL